MTIAVESALIYNHLWSMAKGRIALEIIETTEITEKLLVGKYMEEKFKLMSN